MEGDLQAWELCVQYCKSERRHLEPMTMDGSRASVHGLLRGQGYLIGSTIELAYLAHEQHTAPSGHQ